MIQQQKVIDLVFMSVGVFSKRYRFLSAIIVVFIIAVGMCFIREASSSSQVYALPVKPVHVMTFENVFQNSRIQTSREQMTHWLSNHPQNEVVAVTESFRGRVLDAAVLSVSVYYR